MQHLSRRVNPLSSVDPLHIAYSGVLNLLDAVVRISSIFRLTCLNPEGIHNTRKRHFVGLSDSKVYKLNPRMGCNGRPLCPLYLLELVNLCVLTEVPPPQPLRKEGLHKLLSHDTHSLFNLIFAHFLFPTLTRYSLL